MDISKNPKRGRCIICKGPHHHADCPIMAKAKAYFKVQDVFSKDSFQGQSPAPFVGRFGYPNVNVGLLAPGEINEDVWLYDAPRYWAGKGFSVNEVIDHRAALINSAFKANVKRIDKMIELSQEVAIAKKPVDLEINLEQKPRFRLNVDGETAPRGPNAKLKKAEITSNPRVDQKVDKTTSDTDLLSREGMNYLFKKGFDENFISKILSVGTLGIGKNRKLVPTRWSITATDDTLGKELIGKVKDYSIADPMAFFGGYLGNYYLILLLPEVFGYELYETYLPTGAYTTDHETYEGRKTYASNTVGGYYAARLPILERLNAMKRQGTVIALRFITDEYTAPLGVWVVREATRKSISSKPLVFGDKELLIEYAKKFVKKRFGYDVDLLLNKSVLLNQVRVQKKLGMF